MLDHTNKSVAALTMALPNPAPLAADPSGDKNLGNGQGQQFITGGCLSDADCQTACCATFSGGGICSAVAVQFDQGKQGCGFGGAGAGAGDAAPSDGTTADPAAGSGAVDSSAPGSQNVGLGNGQQFITGQCLSDADCASGCCAGTDGKSTATCSAVAVQFDSGKTGCGFTG